jgi:hypothetical protein
MEHQNIEKEDAGIVINDDASRRTSITLTMTGLYSGG